MTEALSYVEIDIDYCSLSFGVAPCTAVLSADNPTGLQKCFNTRASCADTPNFTNSPVTLRFSVDTGHNPSDIEALPFIRNHSDVAITPGRISLGEDLGQRESVSITFEDRPHSDAGPGFDKYLSDRTYDPYSQGSFWGKFRARQPYLKGRALRVYRGFVGQALGDMECRHYIIDSYNGPGVDGKYTLVAKDILKLLDGDIAQAPALSLGSLSADITSSAGSFTLSPTGIGNTDYPASGKLAIGGNEIVSFTRSGDTVTITGHGLNGTTAVAHSAGDRVQLCLEYTAEDPADIVYDLMLTYGGIDSSYLPHATWQTETGTFNRRLYTGIIAEPTSVRTLVQEMIVQAGLAIWWDPVLQQVNLQVLRAVTADAQTFDETIMRGDDSLVITEQPDKRVSRVQVYFGQRNPLVQQDLPSNYRSSLVVLDTTAEENYGTPAIQTIYSRWIAFGGLTTAERIGNLQLGRYVNPPRKFAFSTIRDEDGGLILGAGYYLENRALQNFDGSRATVPIQITRDNSQADRHGYEAEENVYVSYDAADLLTVIIDASFRNINLKTVYDSLYTAPIAGDVVTFVVNSGVVVGSNSTGTYAMDTGTWPSTGFTGTLTSGNDTITSVADTSSVVVGQAITGTGIQNNSRVLSKTSNSITLDKTANASGVKSLTLWTAILKLQVEGQVIGAGGAGGLGLHADNAAGLPGSAGGIGLKVRSPVELLGAGKVDGGGGGGGSGAADFAGAFGPFIDGSGGGGGAGDAPGAGGGVQASGGTVGSPGTLNSGGAGGGTGFSGGAGGAPGSAGGNGSANGNGNPGGTGGAGGYSVDGVSLLKTTSFTGAFRGSQIG